MTNELKTILFLHIATAMAMVGGILGFLLLYLRARGASSDAAARDTVGNAFVLNRWLVIVGGGLAGIIGFVLEARYDAKGIFDAGKQNWAHIASVLWLVALGVAGIVQRMTRRAVAEGGTSDARSALSNGTVNILVWLNVLVALVIVYLMVFKPFISD